MILAHISVTTYSCCKVGKASPYAGACHLVENKKTAAWLHFRAGGPFSESPELTLSNKYTHAKRKFQKACCYFDLMSVFALCWAVVVGLDPAYTYFQGQILCISFLYNRVNRRSMLLCRCPSGSGKQWRILIVGATEIVVKCRGPIIRFMLANAYKPSIYNYKGFDV